jgi:hypothetical protein
VRQPERGIGVEMRVHTSPFKALAAALLALAATLVLGAYGPALPGLRVIGGWGMAGVALTGGVGLLAYHLARITAVPLGKGGLIGAAMPAAALPLAVVPQIGAAALAMPLLLCLPAAWRSNRAGTLLVPCGVLAALAGDPAGPICAGIISATMLAAAWLSLRQASHPAANDNPWLERSLAISPL